MATFFEPRWHAREREARDRERYWELEFSDLDELLRIDRANLRDGLPPTSFGRVVIDTFARVGVSPEDRAAIEAETRRELLARASQPVETPPAELLLDPFTAAFGRGLGVPGGGGPGAAPAPPVVDVAGAARPSDVTLDKNSGAELGL